MKRLKLLFATLILSVGGGTLLKQDNANVLNAAAVEASHIRLEKHPAPDHIGIIVEPGRKTTDKLEASVTFNDMDYSIRSVDHHDFGATGVRDFFHNPNNGVWQYYTSTYMISFAITRDGVMYEFDIYVTNGDIENAVCNHREPPTLDLKVDATASIGTKIISVSPTKYDTTFTSSISGITLDLNISFTAGDSTYVTDNYIPKNFVEDYSEITNFSKYIPEPYRVSTSTSQTANIFILKDNADWWNVNGTLKITIAKKYLLSLKIVGSGVQTDNTATVSDVEFYDLYSAAEVEYSILLVGRLTNCTDEIMQTIENVELDVIATVPNDGLPRVRTWTTTAVYTSISTADGTVLFSAKPNVYYYAVMLLEVPVGTMFSVTPKVHYNIDGSTSLVGTTYEVTVEQ